MICKECGKEFEYDILVASDVCYDCFIKPFISEKPVPFTLLDAIAVLESFDHDNTEDREVGIFMDVDMKRAVPLAIQALKEKIERESDNNIGKGEGL